MTEQLKKKVERAIRLIQVGRATRRRSFRRLRKARATGMSFVGLSTSLDELLKNI